MFALPWECIGRCLPATVTRCCASPMIRTCTLPCRPSDKTILASVLACCSQGRQSIRLESVQVCQAKPTGPVTTSRTRSGESTNFLRGLVLAKSPSTSQHIGSRRLLMSRQFEINCTETSTSSYQLARREQRGAPCTQTSHHEFSFSLIAGWPRVFGSVQNDLGSLPKIGVEQMFGPLSLQVFSPLALDPT